MSIKQWSKPINNFGARLKQARKVLGLTQAKFAEPIGITNGYVSDLEKGKVQKPSDPVIQTIMNCYRLNRNWLLSGEGDMFVERRVEGSERELLPNASIVAIDVDLLAGVIEGVESELHTRQMVLVHDKKSRVIALLYDYFIKTNQRVDRNKIKDYLSLIS